MILDRGERLLNMIERQTLMQDEVASEEQRCVCYPSLALSSTYHHMLSRIGYDALAQAKGEGIHVDDGRWPALATRAKLAELLAVC